MCCQSMWKFKLTGSKFSIYNLSSNRSTELSPLLLQQFVERGNTETFALSINSGHLVGGFLAFTMISCQIKQSYDVSFLLYRWQLDVFHFLVDVSPLIQRLLQFQLTGGELQACVEVSFVKSFTVVKATCESLTNLAFIWVSR